MHPNEGIMKALKLILLLILLLLGLPLAGVWLAGHEPGAYLEFPPRTHHVEHAPFSWAVFIGLAVVIMAVVLPFLSRTLTIRQPKLRIPAIASFPWWGWLALTLGGHFWILAWTRQIWFRPFQFYTFIPLWLCYIVVINALTWRRTGRCLLTHETKYFLTLYPLSAAFWWFFEYLNRFVENWHYVACESFSPGQYFLVATLSFSTVLPAVLSTEEWLASSPGTTAGLEHFIPIRIWIVWVALAASGAGLFFIGWFPNQLFPLLWVAPVILLVALQRLARQSAGFPEVEHGDWRRIYRFALAALICGVFWEMWNWHSLAKWIYSVPYVDRFHLFEMPLLGYSGYLPFGLECAVIAQLLKREASIIAPDCG
jgi:hypothetical protein